MSDQKSINEVDRKKAKERLSELGYKLALVQGLFLLEGEMITDDARTGAGIYLNEVSDFLIEAATLM